MHGTRAGLCSQGERKWRGRPVEIILPWPAKTCVTTALRLPKNRLNHSVELSLRDQSD